MNHTARNLIRIGGVLAGLAAAAWALRDRLLPAPEAPGEEPPAFRQAGADDEATTPADDLTAVKGIGPVTAGKLNEAGITTLDELASADAGDLSAAIGSSESTVSRWIAAAGSMS